MGKSGEVPTIKLSKINLMEKIRWLPDWILLKGWSPMLIAVQYAEESSGASYLIDR